MYYKLLKVVEPSNPSYNPTGEFIFPSIIKASDYVSNPLGTYYLYYAPHDAPGGICLAYSDNIEGPYTEYSSNPIIAKDWDGKYNVSHVSSPHVIWSSQYNKFLMYFHGENDTTRWAYSTDGVNWGYGGISVTASDFGGNVSESSYARVFEYTIPTWGDRYTMVLMGNHGGTRKIMLATSNDGKSFTARDSTLISPDSTEGGQLAGPYYYPYNNKHYIVYHAGDGNMHITEVGENFDMEAHLGIFHDSMSSAPDNGRSASPCFITVDGTEYMFYEAGARLDATIALAKETTASQGQKFECENLTTRVSAGDSQFDFNDVNMSNGQGNKLDADSISDYVEYDVDLPSSGTWNIKVRIKKQNTRGIFQLYLPQADVNVGSEHNNYAPSDEYVELDIGNYTFNSSGTKQFRFVITGKDPNSLGYTLGLDYIKLTKQ